MNRRLRIGAAVSLAILIVTAVGFAQGPGGFGGRGPGAGPRAGLPLQGLNLTDAQREQVRQLMQQHREQTRTLAERLRAAREAGRQAMQSIPVDETRIRGAMQEAASVETELAIHQARLRGEIHALLTPEQQQRAQQLSAERDARLKQRQERVRPRREQRQPA